MLRGLTMNPKSPDALFMYGLFLWISGDETESVAIADRLLQIDPLSAPAARLRTEALAWGGRYEDALRQDSVARKLDPMVLIWEPTNCIALREMGRFDDATQVFLDFQRTFQQPSVNLARTYARMGKRDEALRVIREIEAREGRQRVDPDFLAIAYAGIGDNGRAIQWLDTAFKRRPSVCAPF
jgi:tetratricopeptide (TPR) repeat protein